MLEVQQGRGFPQLDTVSLRGLQGRFIAREKLGQETRWDKKKGL